MDDGDRLALHELASRYGDTVDDGDWDGLSSIFCDDATFEINGRLLDGLERIKHFMAHEARHPRCHLITNIRTEEVDDGVVVSSRVVVFSRVLAVRPEGVSTGRYRDVVVKGPDGWRIASRVFRSTAGAAPAPGR